jgi:hypothetical protein
MIKIIFTLAITLFTATLAISADTQPYQVGCAKPEPVDHRLVTVYLNRVVQVSDIMTKRQCDNLKEGAIWSMHLNKKISSAQMKRIRNDFYCADVNQVPPHVCGEERCE